MRAGDLLISKTAKTAFHVIRVRGGIVTYDARALADRGETWHRKRRPFKAFLRFELTPLSGGVSVLGRNDAVLVRALEARVVGPPTVPGLFEAKTALKNANFHARFGRKPHVRLDYERQMKAYHDAINAALSRGVELL